MKKHIYLLIAAAMLIGCSFGGEKTSLENTFVIVDSTSNKTISVYETDSQDRIVRTETYMSNGYISRSRDFGYDTSGYVSRMIERGLNMPERTILYTNDVVLDSEGRIERVMTTGSDGKTYESFFGYDEAGTLRGTAVRVNNDTIVMKDYPYENK